MIYIYILNCSEILNRIVHDIHLQCISSSCCCPSTEPVSADSESASFGSHQGKVEEGQKLVADANSKVQQLEKAGR